ncbi:MAG: 50S ribosomal protein L10 [Bacillota bacterium]
MAIREDKKQVVQEIVERLQRAQSAVFVDYRGLNVAQDTILRRRLREAGVEYRVLKNTMINLAASQLGIDGLAPHLEGPTAVAFGYDDPVAPAKILAEFVKENKLDKLTVKTGILEGKVIGVEEVKRLADLPSREVLLAQVLAGIQAPLTSLVSVLQAPLRNMAYGLEALRKQRAEAGA